MNLSGLAPDSAPPVEAPLVLFYLMPVFLVLAGVVLAWQGDQVMASRWSAAALAATHFLVLGALAPVMCGALLQVAPVLLAAPYPWVGPVARLTAAGLGSGALLLGGGFLFSRPGLLLSGGIAVAAGLAIFLAGSYRALAGATGRRATLWAVRLAVSALAVTVALGLTLAAARLGWVDLPLHLRWVDSHVAWGLAGWVGLLLAGIGMEIIPLFHITGAFPAWLKRALPISLSGLLLGLLLGLLVRAPPPLWQGAIVALFIVHLLYNVVALYIEQRRQRPRRDASLWLWQASHVAVCAAFLAWLCDAPHSVTGILLLAGALCFVIGALMKIVPFLTWLDLQQRRVSGHKLQVGLPRLRTLWPERAANAVALSLCGAILATLAGSVAPPLAQLGGGLLVASGALLGHAFFVAARLRRTVVRQFDAIQPSTRQR